MRTRSPARVRCKSDPAIRMPSSWATCEDVTSRVFPGGLAGYFDTGDYRPRYLDDPQRNGSVVRLRVAAYEYLAMTPANRALLSITAQHPRAQIVTGVNAAAGKYLSRLPSAAGRVCRSLAPTM